MSRVPHLEAALLVTLAAMAGCAGPFGLVTDRAGRPAFRDASTTVAQAGATIVPGRDDQASVEERLGPAERLRFASGYEVWVWRDADWRRQARGSELLVLFDPAGKVSQVRARQVGS